MSETELKDPNDPNWREMLRHVLIASDSENKFWSPQEVARSKAGFAKQGEMPTLDVLYQHFGEEALDRAFSEMMKERHAENKFNQAAQGIDSPCHECGATSNLTYHEFGLARILKKSWTASLVSAAASAATLPLLGAGALLGSSKTANILRFKLVLCQDCVKRRKNIFGAFVADADDCNLHPLWQQAREADFTKFIGGYELKMEWR